MGKRHFFNYLLIENFLEKNLTYGGKHLFKELLELCLSTKKMKNIIEYNFLETKVGYNKNIIEKLLYELQSKKLAQIQTQGQDRVCVALKMKIHKKEDINPKDELIGKAIYD